jgi:nitrite reductase/ring-hydroxylating ferredoxin subunit
VNPPALERRVFAASLNQLRAGAIVTVKLTPNELGQPREAIVLTDPSGAPRAYLNECRHLPVPLDAASRVFLVQGLLQCATHGARYRVRDGMCVAGPCRGLALFALELRIEGDDLYLIES